MFIVSPYPTSLKVTNSLIYIYTRVGDLLAGDKKNTFNDVDPNFSVLLKYTLLKLNFFIFYDHNIEFLGFLLQHINRESFYYIT